MKTDEQDMSLIPFGGAFGLGRCQFQRVAAVAGRLAQLENKQKKFGEKKQKREKVEILSLKTHRINQICNRAPQICNRAPTKPDWSSSGRLGRSGYGGQQVG